MTNYFSKEISEGPVEATSGFWYIYQQTHKMKQEAQLPLTQLNTDTKTLKTPDEILSELDELVGTDEAKHRKLVQHRGGCSCHLYPPCGNCCTPLTLKEAEDLGWYKPVNLELMVRQSILKTPPEDVKT